MEILNVKIENERKRALELCKNLMEKHALIPIVGSGFSFGAPTDKGGTVPSVEQLRKKLCAYISKYSGYDESDLKEIEKGDLSKVSSDFWGIYDRMDDEGQKSFYTYVEENFQDINFQNNVQKAFLEVRWPCMFTLNYDSLIENSTRIYYPIVPYDKINRYTLNGKKKLYKLHGDAKRYVTTGDKKYFILSRDQYVESLKDDRNSDMLNELLTVFSSKSVLFFGCGLSEELDLLYSSQITIKEKVKGIDPNQQAIIYISYETGENAAISDFSKRKEDQLTQYGVTHVLRIFSEQESEHFFSDLAKMVAKIPQPSIERFLEKYSSVQFDELKNDDTACRAFLFEGNRIWKSIDEHIVTIPGYAVKRSPMSQATKSISNGEPLCFISGNFFSGKTFFLLELARYFMSRKVYIFPSGIRLTDSQLGVLLEKEDALYCFDAKSLNTYQVKKLCDERTLDKIKSKRSSAVIVIEASDAPMYKYIFEAHNATRTFQQFWISGVFNTKERQEFNKKIGAISLPPYVQNETLLDYVVDNEKNLVENVEASENFLNPEKELLAQNPRRRTKALIMLATEIRIPAKRAIQFGIDGAINELIDSCRKKNGASVIERDYSTYEGNSSGYEFVCNSKYWIIRALSAYAKKQKDNINIIADSYLDIIRDYRGIYKDNDLMFYQNSEPYYFFDHIQMLFNQRWFSNSSALMNKIYDRLLPVLSESFQFLHQKAKGKLEIARVQIRHNHLHDARDTLNEAVLNITRAIKLAELYPNAKNIEETLLHMTYTKGRILIECSGVSVKYVPEAVDACYKVYDMQQSVRHDAYDFTTGTGKDKESFERFKYTLLTNSAVRGFDDLDIRKAETLIRRWSGKKFKLTQRKKK